MALTRDAVVWGFRLILGRDPGSEEGIRAHLGLADEAALVETLLRSQEFRVSGRFAGSLQLREAASAPATAPWAHVSRTALKLVIFGNCQASGMGQLVQAMTGDAVAQTHETTPGFIRRLHSGEFDLEAAVGPADLVWVQMVGEVMQAITKRVPRMAGKVRQLPPLNYSGFHPDCVYIRRADGPYLQGPMGEYQSSIAFWAWRQGLDAESAVHLFRDEVFEHLGFHDYHLASSRVLMEHGRRTGLSMASLLDRWREHGCFMHTVNHPKVHAMGDLVAAALRREGIVPIADAQAWVDDRLARWPVWPVYPAVARASGCGSGSYMFKLDRGLCPSDRPVLSMDLPTFVRTSFEVFERAGRPNLHCHRVDGEAYQGLPRFVRERPSGLVRLAGAIGKHLAATGRPRSKAKAPDSPYFGLPDQRFWRRTVERVPGPDLDPVLRTGFTLTRSTRVATAGSCFAQHIARTLRRSKFNYLVADAVKGMPLEQVRRRGFGMYSARYGNIYTARQLVQLFDRAYGEFKPTDRAWVRADGRFVDPFRPQIEPDGFGSAKEVEAATQQHLADVRRLFTELEVFVFTLGLTEGWRRRSDGAVFPLAPGVAGGRFDHEVYEFVNFGVDEVLADLRGFAHRLRGVNEQAKIIVTVSPVPLIATYEDRHVLVSTVHSKSVLRAAAGAFEAETAGVDYFPSYEIVTGTPSRGAYFEPDLRSVTEAGVAHVMRVFLRHYAGIEPPAPAGAGEAADLADFSDNGAAGGPAPVSPALAAMESEQRALDAIVCDEEAIDRHRG